jgi:ribosomal protein S18 acetylase RimI-like enzyme
MGPGPLEKASGILEMITASYAGPLDIDVLMGLYRSLETEMTALHPMWPLSDGLAEPISPSLMDAIEGPDSFVVIGYISDYPFGFLQGKIESLLPQAHGELIGSIRLVFVEEEARQVSVGEAMRDLAMKRFREQGITKFDAHVLPGHRLAKNFFESGGFAARAIVMHHDDNR